MQFTSVVLAALMALQPVTAAPKLTPAQRIDAIMEDTVAKTHRHLGFATEIIDHAFKGDGRKQAESAAEGVKLGAMYDEVAQLLEKVHPQNCIVTRNNINEITGELIDIRPVYVAIADRAPLQLKGKSGKTIKEEIEGYLASDITHFSAMAEQLSKQCSGESAKIQRDKRVGSRTLEEMHLFYE